MAARVPNFVYIGPDKAGSSWLHEVLVSHPEVYMTPAKDLYFFDRYYDRGLDWYLSQFGAARDEHRVVGEVCQDYLFDPQVPSRMVETIGRPKVMVTLRDPADRAFSSYLYMLKQGQRPGTFLEALESRPELIQHGRYATGLARFCEALGHDRIHVAVFDDLVADPQVFVDDVLTWLEVAPMTLDEKLLAARLPAARARSAALSRTARAAADLVREKLDGAAFVGRIKRSALVQRMLYVPLGSDRPSMTGEERQAVRDALSSEISSLDEWYGLRLAERWGWTGVASGAGHDAEAP
jgi:hypothetical protein